MQSDRGAAPVQLRELSEYTCWQHPFRESHIYMHPAQQHPMRAQIVSSFESENPSEIGGLLLGRIILERAGMSIVIEDVEFIESSGKYFNSCPADVAKLTSALNGPPKRADLTYVGYFRSHIRDGLFLSAEDGELAEGRLRHPDAIFLVVKPHDSGICTGGFFCWQNGFLEKEFSRREAPFGLLERREIEPFEPGGERFGQPNAAVAPLEPQSATTELETAAQVENYRNELAITGQPFNTATMADAAGQSLRLSPPERQRKWRRLAVQAAALLCIGVIAGFTSVLLLQKRLRISHASPGIGLHVERAPGGQFDVTWNRDLAALGRVTSGRLSIRDDIVPLELSLDPQQLRNGKLTYFPIGGDVQFRLELFQKGGRSISESIRTITAATAAGLPSEAWAGRRMGKEGVSRTAADTQPKPLKQQPGAARNLALNQSGASRADAILSRAPQSRPISRLAPEARRAPITDKAFHGKPESRGSVPANALAKPASADSSMPHVPHSPAPKESLRTKAARTHTARTTTYVGPTVIQQVRPRIPVSIASLVTSEQTVQITADIDAEGMVTNAQLTANKGRTSGLLGPPALDAVRQYRFRPASRNGVPVPSQSVISFRFKP